MFNFFKSKRKVILFALGGDNKVREAFLTQSFPVASFHGSPSMLLKGGEVDGVCYVKRWIPYSGWTEDEIEKYYGDL